MGETIKTGLSFKGEKIRLVGAGYTYNASKNSIAMGDHMQAIGKDQFAFGRYGESVDDKAEVVGGGYGEVYDLTAVIARFSGSQTSYDFTVTPSDTTTPVQLKIKKLTTKDGEEWYEIVDIVTQLVASGSSGVTSSEINTAIKVGNVFLFHRSNSGTLIYIYRAHLEDDGYIHLNSGGGGIAVIFLTPTSMTKVTSRQNIRILKWDGTQWNLGDITCDDGEGNTISLRELAKHMCHCDDEESSESGASSPASAAGLASEGPEAGFSLVNGTISLIEANTDNYNAILAKVQDDPYLFIASIKLTGSNSVVFERKCICEVKYMNSAKTVISAYFYVGAHVIRLSYDQSELVVQLWNYESMFTSQS